MNLSDLTRKAQVLAVLSSADDWVDGPDLANERVGGSEGLRRLRELRDDGWEIGERRHPDPARDIWQYRLLVSPHTPAPTEALASPSATSEMTHPASSGARRAEAPMPGLPIWECSTCGARSATEMIQTLDPKIGRGPCGACKARRFHRRVT